jgi:hypothetical protein
MRKLLLGIFCFIGLTRLSIASPVEYIQSKASLQSGTTIYVSSATFNYVSASSISLNYLSVIGSSIATKNYTLVFDTIPSASGQKLGVTSINGSYVHIGGVGDQAGAAGSGITTDEANALILSTYTSFTNFTSTAQGVGISTQNIQAFFTAFMSSSDSRGDVFVNFRSTTDSSLNSFVNFRSTTDTSLIAFVNFRSTTDTSITEYQNFRSTSDLAITALYVFTSTSDARGDSFINFRSTTDANLTSYQNFTSTTDTSLDAKIPNTSGVIFSTHLAKFNQSGSVYNSSQNWVAQNFSSAAFGFNVTYGSAASFGGFTSTWGYLGGGSTFTFLAVKGPVSFKINRSSFIADAIYSTFSGRVAVATITYYKTADGISRDQDNPGLELITATNPVANIATMTTVTFSTYAYLMIVINSTPSTIVGGDILITFNNQVNTRSPIYSVVRTTFPGTQTSGVASSTIGAIGIPIFGDVNVATMTERQVTLTIFNNQSSRFKTFTFTGIASDSSTVIPIQSSGGGVWNTSAQITSISVQLTPTLKPYTNGAFHLGSHSSMQVYGRKQ